jgi:MFS family permease
VSLAFFVLIESRHREPLMPLRFLRSRVRVGANLAMLVTGAVIWGLTFTLTLYGQQVLGYSALEFGLGTAVFAALVPVGSIVGQAVVLRVGFRPVAVIGLLLLGAASLAFTQVSVGGSYVDDMLLGLLILGPGLGAIFVTATVAALADVAEDQSGLASGLSNTAFQIGAALGVAIASTVAVSRSEDFLAANQGADPLVVLNEGFQSAFLACVVLAGIGVALAVVLLGRPRRAPREQLEVAPAPATDQST